MVLVGLELLETIKIYFEKKIIPAEMVITVALIVMARKVIVVDINQVSATILYGIAAVVLALSVGFYILKRSYRDKDSGIKPTE